MKNKFNYLLKTFFLSLVLLFISCETQEEVLKSTLSFKKYEISIDEFNTDKNAKIALDQIKEDQVKNRQNKNGDSQQRIMYNKEFDFYVDTDKIIVIEYGNFTQYTFPTYRTSENIKLENLVINSKNNTDYKAYTVKYTLTGLEKEILLNGGYVDVTDEAEISNLSRFEQLADGSCWESQNGTSQATGWNIEVMVQVPCPGSGGGYTGYTGFIPNLSSGSNGGVGSFPTGETGSGHQTSNVLSSTNNVVIPTPNVSLVQEQIKSFMQGLSQAQRDFLYPEIDLNNLTNVNTTLQNVIKYLSENIFSIESQEFITESINQIIENPSDDIDSIETIIIEKQIDDSTLQPCAKNIVSAVKTLSQNDIAKIISKLGPTDSVYKVDIVSANDLDPEDLGVTDWSGTTPLPYQYKIQLNQQYLNEATQLSIASTVIHEIVHAYFLSLVDDNYETGDQTLITFPLLWDYYVNDNGSGANIVQHNQMAQSYLNILASALQEFHTGIPLPTGTQPNQIYKDLAWGGLENTPPYNQLSENDRDRIQAINRAENTNSPQTANGTTYNPISNPCN